MTDLYNTEIYNIISSYRFSDGSTLENRLLKPVIKNNNIGITIDITGIDIKEAENIKANVIREITKRFGDTINITIVLTSSRDTSEDNRKKKSKIHLDTVKKIVIIAAGKGGVGKSTITALLAHKLKQQSFNVGILDADIYGPSIPEIFGINQKPALDNNKMIPIVAHGIKLNSIGFITEKDAAISWRGPMISKALYQLLMLTKWSSEKEKLDYLLIDTPPGTGDIHLSLLENYHLDSVIFVTTPQQISKSDVERSINLYRKFDIEISAIIENMSYFKDPSGRKYEIFPGDSGKQLATKFNVDHLIKIPIEPELAKYCDEGKNLEIFADLIDFFISYDGQGLRETM